MERVGADDATAQRDGRCVSPGSATERCGRRQTTAERRPSGRRDDAVGRGDVNPTALGVPLQFSGGFLELAIVFFVIAVITGIAGFRGIAGLTMSIAKILVVVFLVLAVVSLLL
jgi:uncharacterized membrane protein YtjA (UPF0391 family)